MLSRAARQGQLLLAVSLSTATTVAAAPTEPQRRDAMASRSPENPAPSEEERVIQLNEEGSELYSAGDFRRAVERFLEAYAVDRDPNLLFNIASCYEGLGDIDAALEKYRAFLAAPTADPEGRPRAERAIERLTAALDEPAPHQATLEPAAPPPASRPVPSVPADPGLDATSWWPWIGLGAGAALGAVGTTFYLMGAADHAELTDTSGFDDPTAVAPITRARADDLVQAGDTKKAIGMATASVGATLVVGAVVWWLLKPPAEPAPSATNAAVDVSLTRAGATLHLERRF